MATIKGKLKTQSGDVLYPETSMDKIADFSIVLETTYANLKSLRDNGALTPGMQYRITDYQCVTTDANTQSAGHQFDIIVKAETTSKLSELAKACRHANDTYFANCRLEAWQLWYRLDNDACEFGWADAKGIVINGVTYYRVPREDAVGLYSYAWRGNLTDFVYTDTEEPTTSTVAHNSPEGEGEGETPYSISAIHTEGGKGVIYRMIDDLDNDCPYDFKNIQFMVDGSPRYTFSVLLNGVLCDASLTQYLNNCCWVYLNKITRWIQAGICRLNRIYVYWEDEQSFHDNYFDYNCHDIVLAINNNTNRFGGRCHHVTLGIGCYRNRFDDDCSQITLYHDDTDNSFGTCCSNIYLGESVRYATFGTSCSGNTLNGHNEEIFFDAKTSNNTVAIESYRITFGMESSGNSVDNSCSNIEFGIQASNNTIGDHTSNVRIGNGSSRNTISGWLSNIVLKDLCCDNIIGSSNIFFDTKASSNSVGVSCDKITFGKGASNNTIDVGDSNIQIGDYSTYNTIGDHTSNVFISAFCLNNTISGWISDITIETMCSHNTLKSANAHLEKNCSYITIERFSNFINLGQDCSYISIGENFLNLIVDQKCAYLSIVGGSGGGYAQNAHLHQGVMGSTSPTGSVNAKTITIPKGSSGTVDVYPTGSTSISV